MVPMVRYLTAAARVAAASNKPGARRFRQVRRRGDLDDFLVLTLDRTVAFADRQHPGAVARDLHLDMAHAGSINRST